MGKQKPLKRAVIKEELVELTGDLLPGVILNQFIYWSERVRDYDKMLKEEKERVEKLKNKKEDHYNFRNGWIYKTASELNEEIMTKKSEATIRRRIEELIEKGWIKRRRNPRNKQDRTYQYRVDIIKIQKDLMNLGYSLDKYPLLTEEISNLHDEGSNLQNESLDLQNADSSVKNEGSSLTDAGTLPETTTESTTETTSDNTTSRSSKKIENIKKLYSNILTNSISDYQAQYLLDINDDFDKIEVALQQAAIYASSGDPSIKYIGEILKEIDDSIKREEDKDKPELERMKENGWK